MSDFKAKIYQIPFRLGLHPRPRWGAYSAPPHPLAAFKGPTSKGREGNGREGDGEGRGDREGRGREGKREGREGKNKGKGKGREGRGRTPHCFLDKSNPGQLSHGCEYWKEGGQPSETH